MTTVLIIFGLIMLLILALIGGFFATVFAIEAIAYVQRKDQG